MRYRQLDDTFDGTWPALEAKYRQDEQRWPSLTSSCGRCASSAGDRLFYRCKLNGLTGLHPPYTPHRWRSWRAASGEHRNSTMPAISSGFAGRPMRLLPATICRYDDGGRCRHFAGGFFSPDSAPARAGAPARSRFGLLAPSLQERPASGIMWRDVRRFRMRSGRRCRSGAPGRRWTCPRPKQGTPRARQCPSDRRSA